VCTPEEQKELNAKTKASAKLMESLLERGAPRGAADALKHRNKLLEYDRTRYVINCSPKVVAKNVHSYFA
jgi:hypothetical protein